MSMQCRTLLVPAGVKWRIDVALTALYPLRACRASGKYMLIQAVARKAVAAVQLLLESGAVLVQCRF